MDKNAEMPLNASDRPVPSENAGPEEKSLEDWYALLAQKPSSEMLFHALEAIYKKERNPAKVLTVLKKHTPLLVNDPQKAEMYAYIAEIEELLGDLTESQVDFERAASFAYEGKRPELLFESARLCAEIGRIDDAMKAVNDIIGSDANDTYKLGAHELKVRLLFIDGDFDGALSYFKSNIEQSGGSELSPFQLSLYHTILAGAGKIEEGERVLAIFKEKYPLSPEYACSFESNGKTQKTRITGYPTPEWIIETGQTPEEERPDISASKEDDDGHVVSGKIANYVQTGSFKMRENADYLAGELEKKGFNVEIVEKKINGDTLFAVLVGPDRETENVSALIARLRDSGFDGFIVSASSLLQ